jgi:hypothetical protein
MSFRRRLAFGPHPSLTRAFLGLAFSLAACAPPGAEDAPRRTLDALFVERGSFVLEEQPGDSIAEPGAFVESATGDLHLADALLPRIRTYRSDGRWVAATGRFGDGPFEFRRVRGLWEEEPGRLWVVGSGAGRIRVFDGLLQPVEERPIAVAPLRLVGGDGGPFILGIPYDAVNPAIPGAGTSPMVHRVSATGELTGSFWTPPAAVFTEPYWISVARTLATGVGEELAIATSLLYPIEILRSDGERVDSLHVPPPSFRPLAPVERGAFIAGAGAPGAREWVQAATVMSKLVAVGEDRLVVVHARLDGGPGQALVHRDYALDVWDLPNRRKIGEDLPLPEGTQVLGGGRFLYLVDDGPPWTVRRLEIRE